MTRQYKIAVIQGDGIGPEITKPTLEVLKSLPINLEFIPIEAGYELWKKTGVQIAEESIELIKHCDSCLKGPTATPLGPGSYKSVAVTLRQSLDLYANIRTFKSRKGVRVLHPNVDFMIVRENTEDLYKGIEYRIGDISIGMRIISKYACERIARFAFNLARSKGRRKVTIVHKANIFKETCGLFREVCLRVSKEYPEIEVEEILADAAALKLVTNPSHFDIILTTNVFGDILSDEAMGIVGGPGLVPSANIGDKYSIFETAHGTAPDIAGKGIANPCSLLLSSVMMLDHLGESKSARMLEKAIDLVIEERRYLTPDLGGNSSTKDMAYAILRALERIS